MNNDISEQKKEILLTIETIREIIDNLEPGTMITMEMPIKKSGMGEEPGTD